MAPSPKKIRTSTLLERKKAGAKISAVTAHDALSASIVEAAGIDLVLVGDSLGMTSLGFETTISVTLEMMLHHAAAVSRAARIPLLVGDLPFMTYKISPEQALQSAGRMVQEGGMEAVKMEGGAEMARTVERVVDAGIPVMAHIGLTPQSVHALGGFKVQGRKEGELERLLADARALEAAGAFALVLEAMPPAAARQVTAALSIPTIGIGAGPDCDGQILVFSDLLGMTEKKPPKLARSYADLRKISVGALEMYAQEIREGKFPGPENTYDA